MTVEEAEKLLKVAAIISSKVIEAAAVLAENHPVGGGYAGSEDGDVWIPDSAGDALSELARRFRSMV